MTKNVDNDILDLPDACLACVFQFLSPGDRNRCSLVCRRWLEIEGQSRHRISLNAQSDLISVVPSLFFRFDAVTKLSLRCDRKSTSITDEALILISLRCQNLIRLKLQSCGELTDSGIESFAKTSKKLKKLSVGSCTFGAKGMNAVTGNCSFLEELSVKRLHGIADEDLTELIRPGVASSSLKVISLKDLHNGQRFEPLISGCKNLKTLRLFRCSGNWDQVLDIFTKNVKSLTELHLERVQVSDFGLESISSCQNLEILHILKTPSCSNLGLISVAKNCNNLRKLHIDGWKAKRIDDSGLISVAKNCPNLKELVLISVNPTRASLQQLATNCHKLERLALCGSETIGNSEISCIAAKCTALRKLCIKSCPISDHGIEALAVGCPNLVKLKVKKCKRVTSDVIGWLRYSRVSLGVNFDADIAGIYEGVSNGVGCSSVMKARLGFVSGRHLLRKWSSFNGGSSSC